jgi:D-proline reductase (dithiol) PrdB
VGLVAREIESAGIVTVTLNMLWPFQRAIGMPRVAAIEHPFGRPYGDVEDAKTQRDVLRAALDVAVSATEPGTVAHLPFRWHEDPKATKWHPAEPSPIIALMKQRQAKRES